MSGDRPRRGISGSITGMLSEGQRGAQEAQEAPAERPRAQAPAPNHGRGNFSTRMRPDLHHLLKAEVLRLEWELGRRVRMEEVLEHIMLAYRDDPTLRERVQRQMAGEG